MKVFIIHVKGNSERKKHILAQVQRHFDDYEFILDGNIADLDNQTLSRFFRDQMQTAKPATSCAYKHLLAYEQIIAQNLDYALVLEDDIFLADDTNSVLHSIKQQLVNLKPNYFISIEDSNLKQIPASEQVAGKLLYEKQHGRFTGAYIISQTAAKNILSFASQEKCAVPIDWYHNLCAEKNLIQIYWSIATPAQQGSANGKIGSLIDERKNKSLYRELKFVLKKFFRSQADKLR